MFQTVKSGPKRFRRTRRELPEGQYSQWSKCVVNFRREREMVITAGTDDPPVRSYRYR